MYLVATSSATLTFAGAGASTFASGTAYDQVALTVTTGSVVVTGGTSGNGTFTSGGTAADIITYAAAPQTATVTVTAAAVVTYKALGAVTVGVGGATSTTPVVTADSITVTFPNSFTVPASGVVGTLAASAGWITGLNNTIQNITPYVTGIAAPASSSTAYTVTFTLAAGDYIGATSQVLINISAGVTNPGTAGSYAVTVATSQETTAVTSTTFAIVNPTPQQLPGVASVYNTASTPILISQYNSLNAALMAAEGVSGGATIKLTAGTYGSVTGDTFSGPFVTTVPITIQGVDPSAANVIIKANGAWSLTGNGAAIVIDSVTIDCKNGAFTLSSSKSATVSNSIVQNGTLNIGATGSPLGTSNITKDTFNVKTGAIGLAVTSATTVTASTFNLTGTGWGISAPFDVTVSGSTFTGATNTTDQYLGNGINVSGSVSGSTIGTSTFTGLSNALTTSVATPMVSFNGNTVTNCGEAPSSGTSTAAIIINSAAANGVNIFNNTITNGTYYIITVASSFDANVNVTQNTFTGNAKAAQNLDTSNTLMMNRNWWGSSANVPANVKVAAPVTAGITYTPALGAAPTAAAFAVTAGNTSSVISASATVGVNITNATDVGAEWGATALSANPVAVTIPSNYTAVKYWDVYGQALAGTPIINGATVDFFGTTAAPVVNTPTSQSVVLFYNAVTGTWVPASTPSSINTFGNYVEIYVGSTSGAVVTQSQFNGTPFVLATQTIPLGGIASTSTQYPTNGATNVPVSGITFTWPAVTSPGNTVTYQFAIAQASANTSANEFAILDYSDNTMTNAEASQETFQYNAVYWWEVRAITMNFSGGVAATGPWTVSMFTTMPMPATTTSSAAITVTQPVTSIVITQPVTTVQSTVTSVVITQTTGTSSQAIPSYLLWAVIAVGAILVIAVYIEESPYIAVAAFTYHAGHALVVANFSNDPVPELHVHIPQYAAKEVKILRRSRQKKVSASYCKNDGIVSIPFGLRSMETLIILLTM